MTIPSLPKLKIQENIISKDFCTAYYIKFAVSKFLKDAAEIYGLYKNQDSNK